MLVIALDLLLAIIASHAHSAVAERLVTAVSVVLLAEVGSMTVMSRRERARSRSHRTNVLTNVRRRWRTVAKGTLNQGMDRNSGRRGQASVHWSKHLTEHVGRYTDLAVGAVDANETVRETHRNVMIIEWKNKGPPRLFEIQFFNNNPLSKNKKLII